MGYPAAISMKKEEAIKQIARRHREFTQKEVEIVLDEFLNVITECLVAGDVMSLTKFGTFEISEYKERQGRHPQTGEITTFSSYKAPRFRASQLLKDKVNGR